MGYYLHVSLSFSPSLSLSPPPYLLPSLPLSQGFDPGKDTYQEPPADGTSLSVDVDPKRSVDKKLTIYIIVVSAISLLISFCYRIAIVFSC